MGIARIFAALILATAWLYLSRRPVKRSSAQQVHMQMKNGLARAASIVHDGAVPLAQFSVSGQFRSHQRDFSQERFVRVSRLLQRSKMLLRTNQNVGRRLRIDVFERENVGIFMEQLRRNLLGGNFAEQTIGAHWYSPVVASSRRMTMVRNPSLAWRSSANFCAACSPETLPASRQRKHLRMT